MTGLVGLLRTLERKPGPAKPFFLGIYNLQTHAFQKLTRDGIPYADGSNHVLNVIHNYDMAFGEFWRYFRQSGLFDNTIVIFTADHTHFPEREFVRVVGQNADYTPVFVDRIPLIIYDPGKTLPEEFDANYASSIDFTPSLIHWLGLGNRANPFVGQSIFDQHRRKSNGAGRSIASAGTHVYLVNHKGILKKGHKSLTNVEQRMELQFIGNMLSALSQLEKHNRIWPRNGNP